MAYTFVKNYSGYDIHVDPNTGYFCVTIEADPQALKALTLREAQEAIERYEAKQLQQERQTLKEVHVVVLDGPWEEKQLVPLRVRGVIAGRSYRKVLRCIEEGKPHQYETTSESLLFFHPRDTRLEAIQSHLTRIAATRQAFHDAVETLKALIKEMPRIKIPTPRDREEALEDEAIFLQQLAAIQPQ